MQDDQRDEVSTPEAKRSGRDGVDPVSQPGEFVDEMRTNRFTPPPDPPETEPRSPER